MADRFTPDPLIDQATGEAWLSTPGAGGISGGKYDGPEAHVVAPWKCPACRVENTGRLELGCTACGSGKPGYHVGLPPAPPARAEIETPAFKALQQDMATGMDALDLRRQVVVLAEAWYRRNPVATVLDAFVAGYLAAQGQTMPAAADTSVPADKRARTIIAALELFKDQVLSQAPDEIADGEWCSPEEVDALILTIKEQA